VGKGGKGKAKAVKGKKAAPLSIAADEGGPGSRTRSSPAKPKAPETVVRADDKDGKGGKRRREAPRTFDN
jgi:hypothetical protein